jgi:hypothetical protein
MAEIKRTYVIGCLHAKKFGPEQIVGEQAHPKKEIEYWIHQVKSGRSDMENEANLGRLPVDNCDPRILPERSSSVRSIAEALGPAAATVDRHLTISLDMQPQHFRRVPHVLTLESRDQWVKGSRALLDVLRQQENTPFRDIITAMCRGYSSTQR